MTCHPYDRPQTVSLCQSVSVSPAVPVTGPISESSHVVLSPISSQDGNITILEQATANASVPAPIEADHEVVSPTSNACQSPLKWNPVGFNLSYLIAAPQFNTENCPSFSLSTDFISLHGYERIGQYSFGWIGRLSRLSEPSPRIELPRH